MFNVEDDPFNEDGEDQRNLILVHGGKTYIENRNMGNGIDTVEEKPR